jgi:hypothetical protein
MCLPFVFLLITRVITWLRLSRRMETWKTAGILLLRHQATVLQRHQAHRPKLNWAARGMPVTRASSGPMRLPEKRNRTIRLSVAVLTYR